MPYQIRSDQGTNFIGAARILANSDVPIEWIFNTPKDPAAGGCWERLIGVVKLIWERSMEGKSSQVATFYGILLEAEFILNSRPLTDIPLRHPEDLPLTPNHFLLGNITESLTHGRLEKVSIRGQWEIRQPFGGSSFLKMSPTFVLKARSGTRTAAKYRRAMWSSSVTQRQTEARVLWDGF